VLIQSRTREGSRFVFPPVRVTGFPNNRRRPSEHAVFREKTTSCSVVHLAFEHANQGKRVLVVGFSKVATVKTEYFLRCAKEVTHRPKLKSYSVFGQVDADPQTTLSGAALGSVTETSPGITQRRSVLRFGKSFREALENCESPRPMKTCTDPEIR